MCLLREILANHQENCAPKDLLSDLLSYLSLPSFPSSLPKYGSQRSNCKNEGCKMPSFPTSLPKYGSAKWEVVPLQYVGSGSSAVLQRAVGLLTCGTGPTQDPHVSDTRAAQLLRRSLIRQVTSKETPKQNKKWPKETRGEPTPSCANCQHPPLQW